MYFRKIKKGENENEKKSNRSIADAYNGLLSDRMVGEAKVTAAKILQKRREKSQLLIP